MEYISIIMNEDAAHDCLSKLGKLGAIQFTDVSISVVLVRRHPITLPLATMNLDVCFPRRD